MSSLSLRQKILLKLGLYNPIPSYFYITISSKCNYKCKMCEFWWRAKNENPKEYLSESKLRIFIDEAKKIGIPLIMIGGGEPFIFKDKVFNLLAFIKKRKLRREIITNGSFLNKSVLDKLDKIGLFLSLSIDGIGKTHDRLRGYPGAFKKIEEVFALFKKYKYKHIDLLIRCVISNENLDEIIKVTELAFKNKAKILYHAYEPGYDPEIYAHTNRNNFLGKKFPLWIKKNNHRKLRKLIDNLKEIKNEYPNKVVNKVEQFESIYDFYTKAVAGASCNGVYSRIVVRPNGLINECKFGDVWDLKKDNLTNWFKSQKRRKIILAGLKCKRGCPLKSVAW